MTTKMRAAVVQLCTRQDVDANLATVRRLVQDAADHRAQLVALPENFSFLGDMGLKLALAEEISAESPGPILGALISLARETSVFLLAGGMATRSPDPKRYHNTALVIDPQGAVISVYHKIHLFDVDIPDGDAVFKESNYVQPGDKVVTADLGQVKLGLSICYDLRFPELYRQLALHGAEILAIPAAFTMHTGKDHWMPLLRARAIENQAFVLAPAQYGRHSHDRLSYGKSCIVDPWGAVLAQVPDREGYAIAELDFSHVQTVRRQLPCLEHARLLQR